MNSLQALLLSILSISVVLSCHNDGECEDKHCHLQHGACISGHCQCVDCLLTSDCPPCHSGYRYCSYSRKTCLCQECTQDAHCQHCPGGAIGKCIRSHHDLHLLFCHCPATTTTTTTTTTTKPLVPLVCSNRKISVIESIAENVHVEDERAGLCPGTKKHQTSDAFIIHKCNATARSTWSKGVSVKSSCSSGSLTSYTPISTFQNHGDKIAAFFVDCLADGSLKV